MEVYINRKEDDKLFFVNGEKQNDGDVIPNLNKFENLDNNGIDELEIEEDDSVEEVDHGYSLTITANNGRILENQKFTELIPSLIKDNDPVKIKNFNWYRDGDEINSGSVNQLYLTVNRNDLNINTSSIYKLVVNTEDGNQVEEKIEIVRLTEKESEDGDNGSGDDGNGDTGGNEGEGGIIENGEDIIIEYPDDSFKVGDRIMFTAKVNSDTVLWTVNGEIPSEETVKFGNRALHTYNEAGVYDIAFDDLDVPREWFNDIEYEDISFNNGRIEFEEIPNNRTAKIRIIEGDNNNNNNGDDSDNNDGGTDNDDGRDDREDRYDRRYDDRWRDDLR